MKTLFLTTLILFSTFVGFSQAKPICDLNGNLLVQKEQLLTAFNAISEIKAINIGYSFEPETMIHSLVFFYEDNAGEEFKLEKNNNNYTLKFSGASKKHTCTGAPCNSCKMSSTWLTTVKCSCNQTSCDTCRCNHTVSETIGKNEELTGKDLNAELIKL